jgi:folate-dependent phosphoribosylglycinamide formyltransferase PurN
MRETREPIGSRKPTGAPAGVVVMLAGQAESTRIVYNALRSAFAVKKVILEERKSRRDFLSRRARRLGAFRVLGQVLFRTMVVPALRATSRRRIEQIHEQYGLDNRPMDESAIVRVPSVNSDEAIAALRNLKPDVVVVNGTRIISERVLASVPARFINMHAGITPLYRGVHGAYWALVEGRRDACGVTVHFVDPGIDTGSVIEQGIIEPTRQDNFTTYFALQLGAGLRMLERAVRDALGGQVETRTPPEGPSRLWSHPTLWGYVWHRLRRGVR